MYWEHDAACLVGLVSSQARLDCNIVDGHYRYLPDLLALDCCRPAMGSQNPAAGHQGHRISTPVCVSAWSSSLLTHPDRRFVNYVLDGFRHGFRIGFEYSRAECRRARRNLPSGRKNADVVDRYLRQEQSLGRLIPVQSDLSRLQVSPVGIIPKPHQPGKWRLILDLSSPRGGSMNDGIDRQLCSLSYTRIDDAARRIVQLGPGTLLAKLDLQSAYRIVPVHADDRPLLGVRWGNDVFLDAALPFGLRSAPKIFSAIADALLWSMYDAVLLSGIHYLDDFLLFGAPGSKECADNLSLALTTCKALGVPVAQQKVEGPASIINFLGIEIDTVLWLLRLPLEKLQRIRGMLSEWHFRRAYTKRELLALIGTLQHAATVIKPGRIFLRRLIDLASIPKELYFHVRLNLDARSDIRWWAEFAERWNGTGLLFALGRLRPSLTVQSDASVGA